MSFHGELLLEIDLAFRKWENGLHLEKLTFQLFNKIVTICSAVNANGYVTFVSTVGEQGSFFSVLYVAMCRELLHDYPDRPICLFREFVWLWKSTYLFLTRHKKKMFEKDELNSLNIKSITC